MNRWIVAIVLAALAGTGIGYWRGASIRARLAEDAARLQTSEAGLRTRLEAAEKERDSLRAALAAAAGHPPAPPPVTPRPKPNVDDSTSRQQLVQMLEERTRELEAADNSIQQLQARLAEMDAHITQLTDQQNRLQASEVELRARLDAASKQAADLDQLLKAREKRLADVEITNQQLRSRTDDSVRRLASLRKLSGDLEDLTQRREAYMTNILGRYREATDLFRAMSLRLDNLRESTTVSGNDLSRIQNAVSLAEEDMRQLRALNTRASRLQKELKSAAQ
jgi:chromosome segregation ATPase